MVGAAKRLDRQAIDVAPPAVPAAITLLTMVARNRDEEAIAVRPDQPLELVERVDRARDGAVALPGAPAPRRTPRGGRV